MNIESIQNGVANYWFVFSFSFLTALTGAMSPGPLLTYTIIQSVQQKKRGYLMGFWIISGHALIDNATHRLAGQRFSFIFQQYYVVRLIGIVGGLILVYFGISLIKDIYQGKISSDFIGDYESSDSKPRHDMQNPVIGGIMVSMSNPYFWIWWASIGIAFLVEFEITIKTWPKLLMFFLGHEFGDLVWYVLISILAFFGARHLNQKAYYGLLFCCALFMVGFGIYLGLSPFFKNS